MNTAFFKKSTIGALTVAIVASGMAFISTPANADRINSNIHINKSKLKEKCNNSGGSYTESGTNYGCVVDNKNNYTVINCTKQNNCIGITQDKSRIFLRSGYISKKWSGTLAKR